MLIGAIGEIVWPINDSLLSCCILTFKAYSIKSILALLLSLLASFLYLLYSYSTAFYFALILQCEYSLIDQLALHIVTPHYLSIFDFFSKFKVALS